MHICSPGTLCLCPYIISPTTMRWHQCQGLQDPTPVQSSLPRLPLPCRTPLIPNLHSVLGRRWPEQLAFTLSPLLLPCPVLSLHISLLCSWGLRPLVPNPSPHKFSIHSADISCLRGFICLLSLDFRFTSLFKYGGTITLNFSSFPAHSSCQIHQRKKIGERIIIIIIYKYIFHFWFLFSPSRAVESQAELAKGWLLCEPLRAVGLPCQSLALCPPDKCSAKEGHSLLFYPNLPSSPAAFFPPNSWLKFPSLHKHLPSGAGAPHVILYQILDMIRSTPCPYVCV